MPRVRKFEDDLIIRAYPEGQMIFEGQGLRLLSSRGTSITNLIESGIEGNEFVGYVEDTYKHLKYTSKLKAGEFYMIIKELCDDNRSLTHLDILLFNDVMSAEHTSRRISFPFEMNSFRRLLGRIIPIDEKHLLFTIGESANNRQFFHKCYILNVLTEEHRCIGEYSSIEVNFSNYIMLKKSQDKSIWHYNFSADDMDEVHEPDIEQLHGIDSKYFGCYNSDCICSVRFRDQEIDELMILDTQRNRVNLTERFPQLKGLCINRN
ncbi:hypothetical protein PCE1_004094 [Barthelona sp. PCE]